MSKSNISGDTKIVMGSPIPKENDIDIPPKSAGEKVIEDGEIVLNLENNTKELIDRLNKSKGNQER